MGNIINNVRKAFNLVSIQATGLNGNSFSDGKIEKMQEIAEIYTNKKKNTPLDKTNKSDIVNKIKELGQQGSIARLHMFAPSGPKIAVGTRSAVVMAMFIAFVSTKNTKIPVNIDELNYALKLSLEVDYPLIKNNSDTQRYLKEASEFINDGYKSVSSYGESQRAELHEIFFDMGGSKRTSFLIYNQKINYFTRTTYDELLTQEDINGKALAVVAQDHINRNKTPITKVNPEQFVLTLHKYPARFGKGQADASVIFPKLDTKIKVAITTLIYKNKEYNYLATKHPQLFNISINNMTVAINPPILNEDERLQVRKNICKHAIYQRFGFKTIKNAVRPSLHVSDREKEGLNTRINIIIKTFHPFANKNKSVADNVIDKVNSFNERHETSIKITDFINYIFNETEKVASDTGDLSTPTSSSSIAQPTNLTNNNNRSADDDEITVLNPQLRPSSAPTKGSHLSNLINNSGGDLPLGMQLTNSKVTGLKNKHDDQAKIELIIK